VAEHNGKQVMNANWGPAISQNPYLSFKFKGAAAGDTIKISWVDNMGKGDSAEAQIK
jgi:sulfur-oxidizing protein SoxZ